MSVTIIRNTNQIFCSYAYHFILYPNVCVCLNKTAKTVKRLNCWLNTYLRECVFDSFFLWRSYGRCIYFKEGSRTSHTIRRKRKNHSRRNTNFSTALTRTHSNRVAFFNTYVKYTSYVTSKTLCLLFLIWLEVKDGGEGILYCGGFSREHTHIQTNTLYIQR